ncbi:rab-GTPase-TBC domain-containing protein [Flagelloscypha sp. PMI_526]|nr:rab-GTPase-TBC domain-containing protein [Flagelloscypha sp. PMI_526]
MTQLPIPSSSTSADGHDEDSKHVLIYAKSKVYVQPTAYARDNIPGFVALVKREAARPAYLLAWIPETLLNEKGTDEWDKFHKVEDKVSYNNEEEDDVVIIDLPLQRPESYAFSVPITSIYSLIVHPPSLSSWYGSIAINLNNGDTLPSLHFHDDESRSFTASSSDSSPPQGQGVNAYPPAPVAPPAPKTWGGEDLLARLRNYAHLLRSTLQPTLFLVDPSRADIEAHSTQLFDDDAVDDILGQSSYTNSFSPVPAHRRPRPLSSPPISPPNPYSHRTSVLHSSLGSMSNQPASKTALLQSFSNLTRATRHAAHNILSHPLAKPIVPHLPDPVKTFVNVNGDLQWGSWVEKGGVGEFDSARIYLAKWSRIVAEEGERARRREAETIPSTGEVAEETSSLGVFELLHATTNLPTPKSSRDPSHPLDRSTWDSWFDVHGKPEIRLEEMKREVFRRGVTADLRPIVWPMVLGVFEWDTTQAQRDAKWEKMKQEYHVTKSEWCGVPDVFERQDVIEERHRIDVDCRRTDRTQALFLTPESTPMAEDQPRYTTISPNYEDIGSQAPTNEHISRVGGVLLTYNFYDKELGYVQGMSDLCAPLYVVMNADEEMTFWCFVKIMERMTRNFLRDQSGMKQQLSTLQQLIGLMDPELYRHLEKVDGLNLFFCYRWILIWFKREFPFDDILRLWEVLWTDYYSIDFVLFVALAVLESHRDMIMRYLVEFDEILKYCNELSNTIELDSTLAQAEVLFLSFAQLVADVDRRQAEEASASATTSSKGGLRNRGKQREESQGSSRLAATAEALSEDLRNLLRIERK